MNKNISKKQIIIFIIVAFTGGWILQAIAAYFANQGTPAGRSLFGILTIVNMYMPLLGVLIARISFRNMGWKPQIKKNLKWIAFSIWMPALLSLAGALLYFSIFPSHLDTGFETMRQSLGEAGMAQLQAQGLTIETYLIISVIMSLTTAPIFNILTAIGEEVGWRGALYPYLKERFGKTTGRVIGGVIWGAWHWPLMILAGFEYGTDYFGAPVLGLFIFPIFTVFFGILTDHVYEKSGTILMPALIHGAIDAWTIYAYLLKPEYSDRMILGPSLVGILSGLPLAALAIYISAKNRKAEPACHKMSDIKI
ncbi:MAG: CPBP family intramembrane metalloprotease [Lachnospiraceae bacterium]|nr:CPBP family intramembrane metalloprotease [Lachnospiraceae bacterium]